MSDKPKEIWAHPHEYEGWSRLGTWNVEFAWDEDEELYVRADRIDTLAAERDALKAENEKLRYVLGGVRGAIKTGRNEPLVIWAEQIDIALAAYRATEGGE